ncbi:MAG: ATP-dependent Clp protease adapter ClpS [Microthrixaceae bacterium]
MTASPGSVVASVQPAAPIGVVAVDDENDLDRPWVVLVWNDPINLMSYVAYVFRKLFGYSEAKAHDLMMQVHTNGRAAVSSGARDEAERDVFRLHEHGLWATMQQDD